MESIRIAPAPTDAAASEQPVDVLSYDLGFTLDPGRDHLEADARLDVAALGPLPRLVLDFSGGYRITEVSRDGTSARWSRSETHLSIDLEPPLRAGQRSSVLVRYRGSPPRSGPMTFWKTPGGGSAVSTLCEPFGARQLFPGIDRPSDLAVLSVRATVPDGYTAISSGRVRVEPGPGSARTFRFRLDHAIPTYLASLNVAAYAAITTTYTTRDGARTMPITVSVLPSQRRANEGRAREVEGIVGVLAELFGEYPFVESGLNVVSSRVPRGMEHPTCPAISSPLFDRQDRDLTDLLTHEIAHQWWGGQVVMKTWDDVFLNEGLATYAEALLRERRDGTPAAATLAARDDRRYAGRLRGRVVANPSAPFRDQAAIYGKAAYVFHMLRRELSDETFFRALRAFGDERSQRGATRQDLREVFERVSGQSLKAFFDQWLETARRPILTATLGPGGRTLELRQIQPHTVRHPRPDPSDLPFYVLSVKARLSYADGSREDRVVATSRALVQVALPRPAIRVELDPERELLMTEEP